MFYLLAGMPTKLSYATCGRSKAKICFPPTVALSFVKLCVVAFHSLPNLLAYVVGDLLQRRSSWMWLHETMNDGGNWMTAPNALIALIRRMRWRLKFFPSRGQWSVRSVRIVIHFFGHMHAGSQKLWVGVCKQINDWKQQPPHPTPPQEDSISNIWVLQLICYIWFKVTRSFLK